MVNTAEELRARLDVIAAMEPGFAAAIGRVGYPLPRMREPGYETLLRTIVGQQVSVAAAAAVWRRLETELGAGCAPDAQFRLQPAPEDRKSTRLNSSH